MGNPYLLLFFGLLLIYVEFFLPSGLFALVGSVLVAGSLLSFIWQTDSGWHVLFFFLLVVSTLIALCKLALWQIAQSARDESFRSDDNQEGFRAESYDPQLVGKGGRAITDLRPSGKVSVEGKRYDGLAAHGYLEKNSPIRVLRVEGALLVAQTEQEDSL